MNKECHIIRDVLPLYVENIASDETKTFVEEHIADCAECRGQLENMKVPSELPAKMGTAPLKNLKRKLFRKKIAIIAFTAAIVFAVVVTGFAFLTSPQYLPYSDDILTLSETGNGTLICSFRNDVTGYNIERNLSGDGQTFEYHISAWKTAFDEYFAKNGKQSIIIEPKDGIKTTVYYSLNNTADDILIYGSSPYDAIRSLPRLVLGYYLLLAIIAGGVLAVLMLIFRKKTVLRLWTERFLLFPASYIVGHVCIKGFSTTTYSSQRDFLIILLVTILIYLVCLLGINLYRARKEGQSV